MSRLILLCLIGIIFCQNWSELSGPYEDSSGTSLVISGQTLSYEGGQCSLWTTDDPNYLGVDPSCGVDYIAISKEQGPVDGIYFGETYYHKSTNVPSWFKQSRGSESDDENVWGNEGWNGYNGYEDDNEYRDQDQYQNEYEDSAPTTTSRVTGKKRALLVGINYKGTSAELGGCINDVKNHKKVLIEKFGFLESDIKMLTEEQDKRNHPTKANIEAGIAWLTKGLQPGDLAVFHYSGHGSQVPDTTGKEKDGKTEVLVPLDFDHGNWEKTFISDQFINQNLVRAIPKGVKTVAIFDCCHSGTVSNVNVMRSLDLEDDLDIKPRFLQPPEWMMKIFEQMMEEFLFGHQGQQQGYQQGHHHQQQQQQPQKPNQQQQISHTDGAASAGGADPDVEYWSFSGCRDDQTSADASLDGMRQGAFTWGYLKSMQEHNYDVTFSTLHNSIKSKLAGKFQQVPILATTRESRLNAKVMR